LVKNGGKNGKEKPLFLDQPTAVLQRRAKGGGAYGKPEAPRHRWGKVMGALANTAGLLWRTGIGFSLWGTRAEGEPEKKEGKRKGGAEITVRETVHRKGPHRTNSKRQWF